jgi:two-component system response regulator AtoC
MVAQFPSKVKAVAVQKSRSSFHSWSRTVKAKVLIIDDEPNMVALFKRFLTKEGFTVQGAGSFNEGSRIIQSELFDVIVSDLALGDGNGLDLLKLASNSQPHAPFIVITGVGSVESAVEAMKQGAFDYISKPFQKEEMTILVKKALQHSDLNKRVRQLQKEVDEKYGFSNIIGRSKKMKEVFEMIQRVASTNSTVLITGESGTGKEMVAKAVHYNSLRKDGPFIAVDCGVIPENLIESELFGHVKGAFTGADRAKKGLFAEAHTGTLFLDEIGNLPIPLQAKLLRALQEREIKPVGSNEVESVDVRVVAATKEDLKLAVEENRFRNDLYYRLSVIPIKLPPLHARTEDIPLLVKHFLGKICKREKLPEKQFTSEALNVLINYKWPGNVRELENLVERMVLVTSSDTIEKDDLPDELLNSALKQPGLKENLDRQVQGVEKDMILDAIEQAAGNKTKAAKILGISRASLYNKINQYGIE